MDTIYPHSLHETMRMNESLQTLSEEIEEEIIKKLTTDIIAVIKNKQTEMTEQIIDTGQNATYKYHELYADLNKIKGILNETREDSIAGYHELREDTNDHFDAIDTTNLGLKQSYDELKLNVDRNVNTSGTTYVRWGRNDCPETGSEIVYAGYAGGSWYNHSGAAVSLLCLPEDPDWAHYTENADKYSGFVYGTEYEWSIRRMDQFFGTGHAEQDVSCAVCIVQSRSSAIMVPGKTTCHPGWTLEYSGYLMSGYYNHAAARDYYCIDKEPVNVAGGGEGKMTTVIFFSSWKLDVAS